MLAICVSLCSVNQRYNLKAIHNTHAERTLKPLLCSVNQRYNLKAIHNYYISIGSIFAVVFSQSKIQSKSNSQQYFNDLFAEVGCVQSIKDTI